MKALRDIKSLAAFTVGVTPKLTIDFGWKVFDPKSTTDEMRLEHLTSAQDRHCRKLATDLSLYLLDELEHAYEWIDEIAIGFSRDCRDEESSVPMIEVALTLLSPTGERPTISTGANVWRREFGQLFPASRDAVFEKVKYDLLESIAAHIASWGSAQQQPLGFRQDVFA